MRFGLLRKGVACRQIGNRLRIDHCAESVNQIVRIMPDPKWFFVSVARLKGRQIACFSLQVFDSYFRFEFFSRMTDGTNEK